MNILFIVNFPGWLDGRKEKGRFLYLSELLCNRGHKVEMIVSDFDHINKRHRIVGEVEQDAYNTKITVLHEPGYPNNICIRRLWSHYVWGRNVEKYIKKIQTPDVIYCSIPSLTPSVKISKYCRKNDVKFVVDIQDLWPEAFVLAIRNQYFQKLFRPLTSYINKAYAQADVIVAVSQTYANRALSVNKKTKKGLSVYLGNDGGVFEEAKETIIDEKKEGILQLCYIGTLGYSYDIKCAIDGVALYSKVEDVPPLRFVIIGTGPLKDDFEQYARVKGIDATFVGNLPYPEMVAKMCNCDILINPIVKGAAQSITNKVGDYALAGLPVVNTQENLEYRSLIEEFQCGINCRVGNSKDIVDALVKLAKNPLLRKEMGANARRLGELKFDRRLTYNRIIEAIE